MRRLTNAVGILLMVTAVIHLIVGVVLGKKALRAIGRDRVINAVDPHTDRQYAFWFLGFGVILYMYGQLVQTIQRRTGALPAFVGWQLLAVGTFGVLLMPVSGFWIVLALGGLALRAAKQGTADRSSPESPVVT